MVRCRLADTGAHRLAGALIDRNRALKFRLDGIEIDGFAGDTVLSAVMGAGFFGFGTHEGAILQLTGDCPFFVHPGAGGETPKSVIHAARLQVADAMELSTLAPLKSEGGLRLPFARKRDGLRSLDQSLSPPEPNRDGVRFATSTRSAEAGMIVVGGGLAGLSAALEGARQGLKIRLFDRGPVLGGLAGYFGRAEGERSPEDAVAGLAGAVETHDAITVHKLADVTTAGDGAVVALATESAEYGAVAVAQLTVRAPHIVLATGTREKLPLFAGNRAVGVVPSIEAWRMASLYGVWHGETAQFALSASQAYRFALALADAGVSVARILDSRPDPASRFIAFAKAYGIRLTHGAEVFEVEREEDLTGGLKINSRITVAGARPGADIQECDTLVISAGLQPDLTLWLQAGGGVAWDAQRQILMPSRREAGIALAGASAGFRTLEGAIVSGANAARLLLKQKLTRIEEKFIDEAFESPDGVWPVSLPAPRDGLPGYYDTGASLATIPLAAEPRSLVKRLFAAGDETIPQEAIALSIVAAAAKVASGEYEPQSVPVAAAERIVESRTLRHESLGFAMRPLPAAELAPDEDGWTLPAFLEGRFGAKPGLYLLKPGDDREVEPGRLIFLSSDLKRPEDAIGVALGAAKSAAGMTVVLCPGKGLEEGQAVSIADLGVRVPGRLARLLRRL